MLARANKGNYAIGAFNINNMEILQAVIRGAEKEKAPVIIQTSEGAIKYAGMKYLVAMVEVAAQTKIPVALHLDHGKDLKIIKMAIKHGYTSIMIDASTMPFSKNVAKTKKVVNMCHRRGIAVEAELGALRGKEDLVSVSERDAFFTDPEQAKKFVKKTRCDFLAVSIGTSHGAYKFKKPYSGETQLDIERLEKIKELVKIPLVLHGASSVYPNEILKINRYGGEVKNARGIDPSEIKKAIKTGINKVNTDSDLRLSFTGAVRASLAKNPAEFDPRKILGPGRDAMEKMVRERIRLFGSSHKA